MNVRELTFEEWEAEGERRFGPDRMTWRFVCPVCGHITSVKGWRDAGAGSGEVAFSCIGRHVGAARRAFGGEGSGPCDYAGGGLFRLNPVRVLCSDGDVLRLFEFADAEKGK